MARDINMVETMKLANAIRKMRDEGLTDEEISEITNDEWDEINS